MEKIGKVFGSSENFPERNASRKKFTNGPSIQCVYIRVLFPFPLHCTVLYTFCSIPQANNVLQESVPLRTIQLNCTWHSPIQIQWEFSMSYYAYSQLYVCVCLIQNCICFIGCPFQTPETTHTHFDWLGLFVQIFVYILRSFYFILFFYFFIYVSSGRSADQT